jgi:hypothetical protein
LRIVILFIILAATKVQAFELFETHSNARAMGMGGAYAAVVDDDESLWYNPAGIAKNTGFYWKILDPKVGVTDVTTAMDSFSDLSDQATFESALNNLYGEPIWLGASGKTSILMPYFAAAYFYDVDASIIVDNPVSPTLTTNYITDSGVALGTGFSIASIFQMGFVTKYITRSGIRKDWGAATVTDIIAGNETPDIIFDQFSTVTGIGYAFDMGMNLTLPTVVQPTLSFVWKNIGNTSFRAAPGDEEPPTEDQNMLIAASMLVDLPFFHIVPAIEIRHLNNDDAQLGKKIHMGVEIGLPLIDIRAGFYQGYYSLGAGLDLGLIKIDAATWGTELGGYPGQYESRRYMVQATLEIGFDFGGGGSGGGSGGSSVSGGGSGGKGGSGSSYARKRKVKLRR